ncbi:hypothetical protein DS2_15754 [Catenovulum agarivorans DS-2]|uniref:Transmembrane protein n=1 Tax=Catenovulum agarivorans DS-2 TaxID=1328313 RepID=W7QTM4_9ALTE|nr:hypothetical protein [Catenovulum agarivorans]EWH08780.1 hypothetical protein DS2_15754 [Catenovulum agarivorans DS-2]
MSKSIEQMWKDGFVNETQLTAPKINDLYNRKSQNIVDKLQRMFAINIKAIIGGSLVALVMFSLIGAPFLGVYICLLLVPLVLIAKRELGKSYQLSKGLSSYDYIINFNDWLQHSIAVYAGYYKYFYPLLFIGMAVQAVVSDAGGKIIGLMMDVWPTEFLLWGVPYYLLLIIVGLILIVARFSDALYRLDLNIIYGRQFKKLEELIADMQELRK